MSMTGKRQRGHDCQQDLQQQAFQIPFDELQTLESPTQVLQIFLLMRHFLQGPERD